MFAFHYTSQEHAILLPNSDNLLLDVILNDEEKKCLQERVKINTCTDFGGGCNYGNYLMVSIGSPGKECCKGTYPIMLFQLNQLLERMVQDAQLGFPTLDVAKLIYFNSQWAHGNQDADSIIFRGNVELFVQQVATKIAAETTVYEEELETAGKEWKLSALDLLKNICSDLAKLKMHDDTRASFSTQCEDFFSLLTEMLVDVAKITTLTKAICNLTGSARLFFLSKHIDLLGYYVQEYHRARHQIISCKRLGGNELVIKLPIYTTAEYGYCGFQCL